MSRRDACFVKLAALVAGALLLTATPVLAGDRVHAPSQTVSRSQPRSVPFLRPVLLPVTISLSLVDPAQAAFETPYITLRGPDGLLRRFALEGGPDEVSSRVVVLQPGQSLTVRLTANK